MTFLRDIIVVLNKERIKTNKQCTMTSLRDIIVVLNALYNKRNTDIKSNEFDFISVLLLLCIAY